MKKIIYAVTAIFAVSMLFVPVTSKASGQALYTNPETGYSVYIDDTADLLNDGEEKALALSMQDITQFCSVLFYSTNSNPYSSTERLAQETTYAYYGDRSEGHEDKGTSFIIDMDERNIWIYSRGGMEKELTNSYSDTITDNVYKYASAALYYECANEAFLQMYKILDGQRIAQPMKYTSNVLLALLMGFFVSFVAVLISVRSRKASNKELIENTNHKVVVDNPNTNLINTTKTYSPRSSSSGGSSGGGGGGGGHSGGGGGGHGF